MSGRFPVASGLVRLGVLVLAIAVVASGVHAQPATAPAGSSEKPEASGTYCGVYCVYTALQMSGRQATFADFLKPEYIGSYRGSTLAELQKAAQDHGLYAQAVGNLTSRELRSSPYPIILHVKSSADSKSFDHYVLCVGADEKEAWIYDPPRPIERVSFAELSSRWDGIGLVVSSEPIRMRRLFWRTWRLMLGVGALAAIAGMCWHRYARRNKADPTDRPLPEQGWSVAVLQAGQLAALALLVGIGYHCLTDEGLLVDSSATAKVVQAHAIGFLDKLDVKDVRKEMAQNAVLIDARLSGDYVAGHIDGAISVPVSANSEQRLKAVAGVPKTSRIILYCQSDQCPFAGKVATSLLRGGYSNLALFPGGWMDWVKESKTMQ